MSKIFVEYSGLPASALLNSSSFSHCLFKRHVDDDLPELSIDYTTESGALNFTCDADERIRSIFLKSDEFGSTRFHIPFMSCRREVLKLLGVASRSSDGHVHPILGEFGPWVRYDYEKHSIHFEFHPHIDRIKMVTLMRADAAP